MVEYTPCSINFVACAYKNKNKETINPGLKPKKLRILGLSRSLGILIKNFVPYGTHVFQPIIHSLWYKNKIGLPTLFLYQRL